MFYFLVSVDMGSPVTFDGESKLSNDMCVRLRDDVGSDRVGPGRAARRWTEASVLTEGERQKY